MEHFDLRPHKNTVLAAKILHAASATVFLLCGILLLCIPEIGDSAKFRLAGGAIVLIGGAGIYGYFSNDMYRLAFQSDFAIGIFNVLFGGLMVVNPQSLSELLACAIGIIALVDGGNKCQISFEGFHFGLSKWFLVLISGVVEVGVGAADIICAVNGAETLPWIGSVMAVVGAVNFWTTMYMVRVKDSEKKQKQSQTEKEKEI